MIGTVNKSAQMRVLRRGVSEGEPGAKFWATVERAKRLIASGEAALVNAGAVAGESRVLERNSGWPFDRFSRVRRVWDGATVALLAGGPSLKSEQVELVRDRHIRTIAVNDAYLIAPFADVCYFADSEWWTWHKDRIAFRSFAGEKCSIRNTGMNVEDPAVHLLRNAHEPIHGVGLSLDPTRLVTGRNSGYQALNLAILTGAARIILLGYDARGPKEGERSHWFGDHPKPVPDLAYEQYRRAFSAAENDIKATGVRVINCSPGSEINSFEKRGIADALSL
jgi:hypothetical protein